MVAPLSRLRFRLASLGSPFRPPRHQRAFQCGHRVNRSEWRRGPPERESDGAAVIYTQLNIHSRAAGRAAGDKGLISFRRGN